jgi:hypothetical protein
VTHPVPPPPAHVAPQAQTPPTWDGDRVDYDAILESLT